jgi:hypothetical protein
MSSKSTVATTTSCVSTVHIKKGITLKKDVQRVQTEKESITEHRILLFSDMMLCPEVRKSWDLKVQVLFTLEDEASNFTTKQWDPITT